MNRLVCKFLCILGLMTKVEQEIIDLLKTGDFTVAFHDQGECSIYKGIFEYDDLPEKEDYTVIFGGASDDGYAPALVIYLCEALKGKCVSI